MDRLSLATSLAGQCPEAPSEPGLPDKHDSLVDDPRSPIDRSLEALVPVD